MNEYSIIPRPVSVQYNAETFQCAGFPEIKYDPAYKNEAQVFANQIRQALDKEKALTLELGAIQPNQIVRLKKDDSLCAEEAYRLEILVGEITASASTGTGIYRGLQTLRQLFLSNYNDGVLTIPGGLIEDRPRFPWRGFMLDCSRYFYSVDFIKKLLDALSLQHINIFHWHLTDDQGWRLPIEPYPLLIEIGSKRRDHRLSGSFAGEGFYSKDEIKGIVAYAAERHIEVVPEVDLPGHTSSVLAAYPGLGCTGGPYQVEDRYGIFEDVLCAGNDGIFPLAEAVFDTLAELFPSKYVHIGGDEVLFNRWAECPKCRRRMEVLGLGKPAQLQSWITSRLAEMLKARGKTAIGWDEVLENTEKYPLPLDMIVQSWRGKEGGNTAIARGHRVIMSPLTNGCYLDFRAINLPEEPGRKPIGTIAQGFNLEPITPEMSKISPEISAEISGDKATSLVLGGQGNLWSEVIYAGRIAEYMIFPRICAIAEALWSEKERKALADFAKRLEVHQRRLDRLDLLQYRGPLE